MKRKPPEVERDELVERTIVDREIENAALRNRTYGQPVVNYADDLVPS